jgi:hypothetical protein
LSVRTTAKPILQLDVLMARSEGSSSAASNGSRIWPT